MAIAQRGSLKNVLIAALVGGALGALALKFGAPAPPKVNWPLMASVLGFVAFQIYWLAAATDAPAKSVESAGSRRVHEVLLNIAYVLLLLPAILPMATPVAQLRFLPASPVWAGLGLVLQAVFFGLAIWARRSLGRNWSGRIEIKVEHQLVRSGPYRMLRHPIYTAILGMAVGMALVIGKWVSLCAVAIIVFAYIRKIRLEESALREGFGPQYDEYRRATWGFIPLLF